MKNEFKINLRKWDNRKKAEKNVLYKISKNDEVVFSEEKHEDDNSCEKVILNFIMDSSCYGIYSNEYRPVVVKKEGTEVADILAFVVDEIEKKTHTYIYDVKRNICAFSDNLSETKTLLNAIKNVEKYLNQISTEILHKKTITLYLQGYSETETVGIITRNFEPQKFLSVAKRLQELLSEDDAAVSDYMNVKMKYELLQYQDMIKKLYDFANKKAVFHEKEYFIDVVLLEEKMHGEYATELDIQL